MVDDLVAVLFSDSMLAGFDFLINELDDFVVINVNHVVVVIVTRQLKYRMARLKIMALNQTGRLKLRQDAIDRCQSNVIPSISQTLIDIFGTQMGTLIRRLTQDRQNIEAWQGHFQAGAL